MASATNTHDTLFQEAYRRHQAGQVDEAAELYERILCDDPNHVQSLQLLGAVRIQQRAFHDALPLIRRALKRKPNSPVFHHNLASALYVLGRFDEAERHYRRALRHQPGYAEAYFNLSAVRRFAQDDPVLPMLEKQLRRTDLSDEDLGFLHFAAGKIYNDLARYDEAFENYCKGNSLRGLSFDPDAHDRYVDKIINTFSLQQLAAQAGNGSEDDTPIFVVGMPRSGTTLVEQILASHDEVFGAGELPDIASIAGTLSSYTQAKKDYPACVPSLPPVALAGFGNSYLNRIRTLNGTARHIVDKSPLNFLHLGLLQLMLPRAHVIHCRRDPLDTCLSCYFQRFRTGQEFSYDLAHLGRYYRSYERLMDHWQSALQIRVYPLQYETLVASPERVCREMIEFCGLPWDDNCLQFHQNEREVTTASSWQVRRPIYHSSAGRWRAYESHLGPLERALKKA